MRDITNQAYLRAEQYRSADNLNARIALHARFSVQAYDWHAWAFDHFDLPADARVLEIGCGPGALWKENQARLPAGWQIVLLDLSPGMVQEARQNLRDAGRAFAGLAADAQWLPFTSAEFDAVIANHM